VLTVAQQEGHHHNASKPALLQLAKGFIWVGRKKLKAGHHDPIFIKT
jgi:hypothetical protein